MISDLFINGCILVSTLFIFTEFLNFKNFDTNHSKKMKVFLGTIYGFLSIIIMIYNVKITEEVFFDFRHIPQIISTLYGGPISVITTGLIAFIFRITYFGINHSSIITSIGILIACLGCAFIFYFKIPILRKWIYMTSYSLIIRTIILLTVLDNSIYRIKYISSLWIGTIFLVIIVYLLLNHIHAGHTQSEILKKEAKTDFLTGLNNVRGFNIALDDTLQSAKKDNITFSILMIDVDFFKQINDTYGHLAGDDVLKQLGLLLSTICRDNHVVSRIGGEEFCILLRNCSKSQSLKFAEKIRSIVENHVFTLHFGIAIRVTVSIGIANYKDTVSDIHEVKAFADEKLYEAKNTGRNKVCA